MEIDTSTLRSALEGAGVDVTRADYDSATRRVVVEFRSPEDLTLLLNAVARYVPEGDPFYERIFGGGKASTQWTYWVRPRDATGREMRSLDFSGLNWKPTPRIALGTAVGFPPEDLPIITELLRDWSKRD
ncbi:MAG: hypothetical protein WBX15_00540 [Thermoanaerobaculia bacterium]